MDTAIDNDGYMLLSVIKSKGKPSKAKDTFLKNDPMISTNYVQSTHSKKLQITHRHTEMIYMKIVSSL